MNLFLFVATEKGLSVLEAALSAAPGKIVGVCSFKETSVADSYYERIRERAKEAGVEFFDWKQISGCVEEAVTKLESTHVLAVSWRYLLPSTINKLLRDPILVFHDSLLPRYRGFAPLPTAMINGEREVGFTVLFAADDVDSGDIVLQRSYELSNDSKISDVISMVATGYAEAVKEILSMIESDSLIATPQDHSKATYSIWRDDGDMQIDWRGSSKSIDNFIRALGRPYKGAWSVLGEERIVILEAMVAKDVQFEIRQPGKIWKIDGSSATVVCGEGMLSVTSCETSDGKPYAFNKLRQRFSIPH